MEWTSREKRKEHFKGKDVKIVPKRRRGMGQITP